MLFSPNQLSRLSYRNPAAIFRDEHDLFKLLQKNDTRLILRERAQRELPIDLHSEFHVYLEN